MPEKPKVVPEEKLNALADEAPSPPDPETTEAARTAFEGQQAPASKATKCPKTGANLVPYEGDNPHKAGSVVCERCDQRFLPDAVLCPEA